MAFQLSPDVKIDVFEYPNTPAIQDIIDMNTLRDALFAVIQYCSRLSLFEFNDQFTRGATKQALIPLLKDAQKKGIIDEYLIDTMPNVVDDNFLIRIIMRRDRDHYRMAMTARNDITDFEFEHTPMQNSFSV